MNLGQAVAICLFEIAKLDRAPVMRGSKPIAGTSEDVDRVTETLLDALQTCGYLKTVPNSSHQEKIRSFVRRLTLCEADAQLWVGMLRQMKWKMTHPK
jgi:tRNA/rRNA methyltransferase